MAGAIGEVAQIVVLYPLDTIKVCETESQQLDDHYTQIGHYHIWMFTITNLMLQVRCQAMGMTAAEVVKDLLGQGLSPAGLLRQLYAGVAGAAICSIAVGAVHYASYESSRRWLLQSMGSGSSSSGQKSTQQQAGSNPEKAPSSGNHSIMDGPAATSGHAGLLNDADATGGSDKLTANVMAAVFAALVTALVESPVELFRHNQQVMPHAKQRDMHRLSKC